MKKEIKVVAIVLVALIVFLAGFGLGATKGININIGSESGINVNVNGGSAGSAQVVAPQTQAPVTQAPTQAPVTQAPTQAPTAAPTPDAPATDAPATDAPTQAAPSGTAVPSTKAEIAAAYNKAINDMRAYSGKLTLKKHDIIDVQLKDLPAVAEKIINPVVQNLTKTEPAEWTFENGVDVTDPNRKLIEKTIPWGREATVTEASLASASATANADGGYTMVITFIAEDSNFDGTKNTSEPTQHMTAMDPLNLGSLDLGPISISQAALHYPGATCTATVDGQGRLVKLYQQLPLEGSGTGKAGISLTLNLAGSMDGNYEFTYA